MPAKKKYTYAFPRPSVTADIVLITKGPRPRVLLIRRKDDPYAGHWALPGGYVNQNEPLLTAAKRELKEETGLQIKNLHQLRAFGDPGRDPRGWTVTIAFIAHVSAAKLKPTAGDDAADAEWHPLDDLPKLAFDHAKIIAAARRFRARRT